MHGFKSYAVCRAEIAAEALVALRIVSSQHMVYMECRYATAKAHIRGEKMKQSRAVRAAREADDNSVGSAGIKRHAERPEHFPSFFRKAAHLRHGSSLSSMEVNLEYLPSKPSLTFAVEP